MKNQSHLFLGCTLDEIGETSKECSKSTQGKEGNSYLENSWSLLMWQADEESWRQPQKPSSSFGNDFGKGWSGITPTYTWAKASEISLTAVMEFVGFLFKKLIKRKKKKSFNINKCYKQRWVQTLSMSVWAGVSYRATVTAKPEPSDNWKTDWILLQILKEARVSNG